MKLLLTLLFMVGCEQAQNLETTTTEKKVLEESKPAEEKVDASETKTEEVVDEVVEEKVEEKKEEVKIVAPPAIKVLGISQSVVSGQKLTVSGQNLLASLQVKIGNDNCANLQIANGNLLCDAPIDLASGNLVVEVYNGTEKLFSGNVSYLSNANLSISSGSSAFGDVNFGSTASKSFILSNSGSIKANLSGLSLSSGFSIVHNCTSELAGGASCNIGVNFAPTAPTALVSQTLTITYTDGYITKSLDPITFTGKSEPAITSVSPANLPAGGGSVTISGKNFLGSSVTVGGVACPLTSQTQTQLVCTAPAASAGQKAIVVSQTGYTLNHAGVTYHPVDASLTASFSSHNFRKKGNGSHSTKNLVITNNGGTQASSVALSGLSAPFSLANSTCGATIDAGASCNVDIKFDPTATSSYSQTLTIGYNSNSTPLSASVAISGESLVLKAVEIVGEGGFCALMSTDTVMCWGSIDGTSSFVNAPIEPWPEFNQVSKVKRGPQHTCFINAGDVYCVGRYLDFTGPASTVIATPTKFTFSAPATDVAVAINQGWNSSLNKLWGTLCAVLNTGAVECLGSDSEGMAGNGAGERTDMTAIVNVGLTNITSIEGAYGTGFCALNSSGTRYCWGNNSINTDTTYGAFGMGTQLSPVVNVPAPSSANSPTNVTKIAMTYGSSCAIRSGTLRCSGLNGYGQLGQGKDYDNNAQIVDDYVNRINYSTGGQAPGSNISSLTNVTALASVHSWGGQQSSAFCAINSGEVYCWGSASYLWATRTSPYQVPGLTGASKVAATQWAVCAIVGNDTKCIGYDNILGLLGDGPVDSTSTTTPTTVVYQ